MSERTYVVLESRAVLAVGGEDRESFLQGLVTNDVRRIGPDRAIYAAFLTPQGKYRHDFFIAQQADSWLFDAEAGRRDDLLRALKMYRLRSRVTLADATADMLVVALPGPASLAALDLPAESGAARPLEGGVLFVDPRLPEVGARAILPRAGAEGILRGMGFTPGSIEEFESLRLRLGLPDGSRDLEVEKALLLENNFDEMHGIDWKKGCYVGQELTARTKYRALIRKRLLPVQVDGALPPAGTPVTRDGKEIGELRSGYGDRALALLRLEDIADAAPGTLAAGDAKLTPLQLPWIGATPEPQDRT